MNTRNQPENVNLSHLEQLTDQEVIEYKEALERVEGLYRRLATLANYAWQKKHVFPEDLEVSQLYVQSVQDTFYRDLNRTVQESFYQVRTEILSAVPLAELQANTEDLERKIAALEQFKSMHSRNNTPETSLFKSSYLHPIDQSVLQYLAERLQGNCAEISSITGATSEAILAELQQKPLTGLDQSIANNTQVLQLIHHYTHVVLPRLLGKSEAVKELQNAVKGSMQEPILQVILEPLYVHISDDKVVVTKLRFADYSTEELQRKLTTMLVAEKQLDTLLGQHNLSGLQSDSIVQQQELPENTAHIHELQTEIGEQMQRNILELLARRSDIKNYLRALDKDVLPPEERQVLEEYLSAIKTKPFIDTIGLQQALQLEAAVEAIAAKRLDAEQRSLHFTASLDQGALLAAEDLEYLELPPAERWQQLKSIGRSIAEPPHIDLEGKELQHLQAQIILNVLKIHAKNWATLADYTKSNEYNRLLTDLQNSEIETEEPIEEVELEKIAKELHILETTYLRKANQIICSRTEPKKGNCPWKLQNAIQVFERTAERVVKINKILQVIGHNTLHAPTSIDYNTCLGISDRQAFIWAQEELGLIEKAPMLEVVTTKERMKTESSKQKRILRVASWVAASAAAILAIGYVAWDSNTSNKTSTATAKKDVDADSNSTAETESVVSTVVFKPEVLFSATEAQQKLLRLRTDSGGDFKIREISTDPDTKHVTVQVFVQRFDGSRKILADRIEIPVSKADQQTLNQYRLNLLLSLLHPEYDQLVAAKAEANQALAQNNQADATLSDPEAPTMPEFTPNIATYEAELPPIERQASTGNHLGAAPASPTSEPINITNIAQTTDLERKESPNLPQFTPESATIANLERTLSATPRVNVTVDPVEIVSNTTPSAELSAQQVDVVKQRNDSNTIKMATHEPPTAMQPINLGQVTRAELPATEPGIPDFVENSRSIARAEHATPSVGSNNPVAPNTSSAEDAMALNAQVTPVTKQPSQTMLRPQETPVNEAEYRGETIANLQRRNATVEPQIRRPEPINITRSPSSVVPSVPQTVEPIEPIARNEAADTQVQSEAASNVNKARQLLQKLGK